MNNVVDIDVVAKDLYDQVSALVEQGRRIVGTQVNTTLTMTYWRIGQAISAQVLGGVRAKYGRQVLATVSRQLIAHYGKGYDEQTLRRMVQFAQTFPDEDILATLWRELSWSHFRELLPIKSTEARLFYATQAREQRLSVRELQGIIARKAFERREIANSQISPGSSLPLDAFQDPYLLDFLHLDGAYQERNLEAAIIHELEAFLLEAGRGWAFVARQKRIPFDEQDYYLDLLFFSRPLRRLIAVELKLGKFRPTHKGQMDFYLKWLNRYERGEGEDAPLGLILCPEVNREQIELLEMGHDGIAVAEYWSVLPPREELEAKLREIMRQAKERVARRGLQVKGQPVEKIV
jgi:predicted nuclease of restriction endonuclease-like (RecB) superfamily